MIRYRNELSDAYQWLHQLTRSHADNKVVLLTATPYNNRPQDLFNSLDELINRFSVEVVNKQFYNEIALAFTKLVGGQRDGKTFGKELNLYGVTDQNKYAEFAVRLIGRIVFCWFLKEKKSENGIPLIPESMLALDSVKASLTYYHDTLKPLFFELLNTNQPRRKGKAVVLRGY